MSPTIMETLDKNWEIADGKITSDNPRPVYLPKAPVKKTVLPKADGLTVNGPKKQRHEQEKNGSTGDGFSIVNMSPSE